MNWRSGPELFCRTRPSPTSISSSLKLSSAQGSGGGPQNVRRRFTGARFPAIPTPDNYPVGRLALLGAVVALTRRKGRRRGEIRLHWQSSFIYICREDGCYVGWEALSSCRKCRQLTPLMDSIDIDEYNMPSSVLTCQFDVTLKV